MYRGEWRGRVVAVKLIDCAFGSGSESSSATQAALAEARLSQSLDHASIVKTFEYAVQPAGEGARGGPGGGTLWMVQQMCNHGTLIEAADRGWLRVQRSLTSPPDMPAVLRTLREIAAGMAFLHSRDVLHCDLTGARLAGRLGGRVAGWVCRFRCRLPAGQACWRTGVPPPPCTLQHL